MSGAKTLKRGCHVGFIQRGKEFTGAVGTIVIRFICVGRSVLKGTRDTVGTP